MFRRARRARDGGGIQRRDAVGAVTSHTVVLLVGAFVVAAAAKRSGIAERLAFAIGGRARTVDQLLVRITGVLVVTAFLVPSTSGRAALMLPVYLAFAERLGERRVRRALAVLFPTVILLSAVASLFGAGAHVVMTELVAGVGAPRIGFLQWATYGVPFAIASSAAALLVVRTLFLRREDRSLPIDVSRTPTDWTRDERIVTTVVVALTVCWLTEPLHGLPAWLAAVIGALLLVAGPLRCITIGQARSALPLDLLFVMAVTAEAGSALARTGAADWIALSLLGPLADGAASSVLVVALVAVVSLVAHLVVTSRTARASVLIPVVILIGSATGLDVAALAYLSTAAAGYCLTTSTSAKPLRVFSTVEDGFGEADLRRLSARLLPLHAVLLVGFSFAVWPLLGLGITATDAARADGGAVTGGADRRDELPWAASRLDGLGVGPRWSPSPSADAKSEVDSGTDADDVDRADDERPTSEPQRGTTPTTVVPTDATRPPRDPATATPAPPATPVDDGPATPTAPTAPTGPGITDGEDDDEPDSDGSSAEPADGGAMDDDGDDPRDDDPEPAATVRPPSEDDTSDDNKSPADSGDEPATDNDDIDTGTRGEVDTVDNSADPPTDDDEPDDEPDDD